MYYHPVRNPSNRNSSSSVPVCCCLLLAFVTVGIFFACIIPFIISEEHSIRFPYLMSSVTDDEVSTAFTQFMADFGKDYGSESEIAYRRRVFETNYRRIAEHNKSQYKTCTLAVNKFADLSDEEFTERHLSKPKAPHPWPVDGTRAKPLDLTLEKNWVTEGKVSYIKDQGNCGSCWTFSSASVVETIHAIKDDISPVRFAEQDLVDCCRTELSNGCRGGEPTDAFDYVHEHGIALEKDYPYKAQDQPCRKDVARDFHIEGYKNITCGSTSEMEETIKTRTMAVAINASPYVFRFYKSGVITSGCPDEPINHGVTVVGAGTEGDTPYWLVRNSWAKNWGDQGYVKLMRTEDGSTGICGIASAAQYVLYKD